MRTFFLKILLPFVFIFLLALPYATKYGAIYWLEENHSVQANIEDVSINLFLGKVSVSGVHIYSDNQPEIHLGELLLDFGYTDLIDQNITVEKVSLTNLEANFNQDDEGFRIGGLFFPSGAPDDEVKEPESTESEEASGWGFGVKKLEIKNVIVDVSTPVVKSQFEIADIAVNSFLSWNTGEAAPYDISLVINGAPVAFAGDLALFSDEKKISSLIKIEGLQVAPFVKSHLQAPVKNVEAAFNADIQLAVDISSQDTLIDIQGVYGLTNIAVVLDEQSVSVDEVTWSGKQEIQLNSAENTDVNLGGALKLAKLSFVDKKNDISVTEEEVNWNGDVNLQMPKDKPMAIKSLSGLDFGSLSVTKAGGDVELFALAQARLDKIQIDALDQVSLKRGEIDKIVMLADKSDEASSSLMAMESLIVDDVKFLDNALEVYSVSLNTLKGHILLNDKGEIPLLTKISEKPVESDADKSVEESESQDSEEKEATQETTEEAPMAIRVKQVTLDHKSEFKFVDRSVTPNYETHIHDLFLHLSNIDLGNQDAFVNSKLSFKMDEYGSVELAGKITPLKTEKDGVYNLKIDAFELIPFSSYAGKYAGLHIKRGVLDANAKIEIKSNELLVENDFYFNQLNLEPDESERSKDLISQLPMPLDVLLDVLRDSDNVIHLKIPVEGSVDAPDFDLQDIYNKAMVKALKFSATYYLTQAVQPLGLIISAGKLAGKAMAPKFEPLKFSPGVSELSAENKEHLKNIAKLLSERKKLRLTLCGAATEQDWQFFLKKQDKAKIAAMEDKALQKLKKDSLLKVANERSQMVKRYFVEKKKIEAKRLFLCNAKIDVEEEKPYVDISL